MLNYEHFHFQTIFLFIFFFYRSFGEKKSFAAQTHILLISTQSFFPPLTERWTTRTDTKSLIIHKEQTAKAKKKRRKNTKICLRSHRQRYWISALDATSSLVGRFVDAHYHFIFIWQFQFQLVFFVWFFSPVLDERERELMVKRLFIQQVIRNVCANIKKNEMKSKDFR